MQGLEAELQTQGFMRFGAFRRIGIEQVEPDEIIVARLIDGDIAAAVVDVEPHNHDPQQEES